MTLRERFRREDVAGLLAQRAAETPERRFLAHGGRRVSYGEVEAAAHAFAAALAGFGVGAGDRVGVHLPNRVEFVVCLFAAARLGAVVVPLDPQLTSTELQYLLRHSEAAVVVTAEQWGSVRLRARIEQALPALPDVRRVVVVGWTPTGPVGDRLLPWDAVLKAQSGAAKAAVRVDPDSDALALIYTTANSGKPKGVVLTHSNLIEPALALADRIGLRDADVVSGIASLGTVFGMGPGVLGTAAVGACLALQEEPGPEALLDVMERERVTVQHGVPSMFQLALRHPSRAGRDLGALRTAVVAGAPVTDETLARIRRELVPTVWVAYGLTEAGAAVAMNAPKHSSGLGNFTTAGPPLAGVEVRVYENGDVLPEESVGEIAIRGPGVMKEYHRQPAETAGALTEDGFLRTGDLGMVDDEGCLHILGRRREIVFRGGYHVFPREVEERISTHPAVLDVAVVGLPDDVLGEVACACVVQVEGAIVTGDELKEFCRGTLAEYKVPDLVRFFPQFPTDGAGRVRRVELARTVSAEERTRRA